MVATSTDVIPQMSKSTLTHHEFLQAPSLEGHDWQGALIAGNESEETLRQLVLEFSLRCPRGNIHARCPFTLLRGLTEPTREWLVESMDRHALLQIFALEQAIRREEAPSPTASLAG